MRRSAFAALLFCGLISAPPIAAQPAAGAAPGASSPQTSTPYSTQPGARPRREPSPGQLALRERQRKCGAEWREAKAKGTTNGLKWPQYWSACNKRMKGESI